MILSLKMKTNNFWTILSLVSLALYDIQCTECDCRPGHFCGLDAFGYDCLLCANGRYQDVNEHSEGYCYTCSCSDCHLVGQSCYCKTQGFFFDRNPEGNCIACPEGTTTTVTVQEYKGGTRETDCSVCAAGFYGNLPSSGCTACPIGSWNNETGQTSTESCRNCTGSKTTENKATTSEDMCVENVVQSTITEVASSDVERATSEIEPSTPKTEPSSSEAESSSFETEPSSSENEPSSSENEPLSSENEPSSSENEPLSSENEPSSSENEPSSSENEPLSSENEPLSSETEPSSSETEPSTSETKSATSETLTTQTELTTFEDVVPSSGITDATRLTSLSTEISTTDIPEESSSRGQQTTKSIISTQTTSDSVESTAVMVCPAGEELIGDTCTDCRFGFFKSRTGTGNCQRCPTNTESVQESGSIACQCLAGTEGNGLMCTQCLKSYHPGGQPGNVTCTRCPDNTFAPDGSTSADDCRVSTNRSRNEWIDFGIHTEACMTDPVTCGTAGGAISLWIKQTSSCVGAYFTTKNTEYTRGSTIRCIGPLYLFNVAVPEGLFTVIMGQSTEWIHIALNFIGPEEGEGIIMYQNGIQIATDERKIIENFSATSRKIVIGRAYTYLDDRYTNAQVDELLFFNQQLTTAEISLLSQQAA